MTAARQRSVYSRQEHDSGGEYYHQQRQWVGDVQRRGRWDVGSETLVVQSSGATVFSAAVGASKAVGGLTTDAGGTTSAKSVTAAGPISFNDDVTLNGTYDSSAGNGAFTAAKSTILAGNTTINSGSGTINFNGTMDGMAGTETLLLANTAAASFSGAIGSTEPLGGFTTSAAGTTAINGGRVTAAIQDYQNTVLLGHDTGCWRRDPWKSLGP